MHLFQDETVAESRKSSQTKQEHITEAKETLKAKALEGSLVVKAGFEEVHMLGRPYMQVDHFQCILR